MNATALRLSSLGATALFFSSSVPLGQGLPFARVHEMVPVDRFYYARGLSGDLDGDGDPDLIDIEGSAYLVRNEDHGRYAETLLFNGISRQLHALVDLDNDGLDDLLTKENKCTIGVWINPGGGLFSGLTSTLLPPKKTPGFFQIVIGDLNDDGSADVYAFEGQAQQYSTSTPDVLFLNDGWGSFSSQAGPSFPKKALLVDLADFDGDGDLDAARLDAALATRIWINDGAGAFSLAPVQPPFPSGTTRGYLTSGDMDVDGDVDLLGGNPVHLYRNEGEGLFTDEGEVLPLLGGELHLADFDGDEDPDVVGYTSGFVSLLFRNSGFGTFEGDVRAIPSVSDLRPYVFLTLDVDRDHDLDLLASSGYLGTQLLLNDGNGSFTNVTRDPWETRKYPDVSSLAGDLDGDRFPDALGFRTLYPSLEGEIYLHRSRMDGTFVEEKLPIALPRSPLAPVLADMDRDGDLDVVSWNGIFLLNDGHAGFEDGSQLLPVLPNSTSLFFPPADLDGDGDPDLLLIEVPPLGTTPFQCTVHLWLNDGRGSFIASPVPLPTLSRCPISAAYGDIDGDADLDVWIGFSYYYSPNVLWSNGGEGRFSDASFLFPPTGPFGQEGAFADLDGDGDLDLLTRLAYSGIGGDAYLLFNDGSGSFTDASSLWQQGAPSGCYGQCLPGNGLMTADIDEDGDVDVQDGCYLWTNDGTGRLEPKVSALPGCGVGARDYDLDGDLDLGYPAYSGIVTNVLRHVSWLSYPRAGKPLTMKVFGPPNTPYQLFSSAGFTEPQPTDFGYLRLATRGARLVASGTLDSMGRAAVTLGIPSDLAIPENTVYWQALVGDPPRLTNLEFTTFSNL